MFISLEVRKKALGHLRAHDQQEALSARLDLCQSLGLAEKTWKDRMHAILDLGTVIQKTGNIFVDW